MINTTPTPEKYWLKEHQITAFWHGFGISNGLDIPEKYIHKQSLEYGNGEQFFRIDAVFFRNILAKYIKWLENYAESWDSTDNDHTVTNRVEFLASENVHQSREDVLKMIELLQKYRIDDIM